MKDISILIVASEKRKHILPILIKSIIQPGNREYIKEVIINPLNVDNQYYKSLDFLFKYNINLKIVHECDKNHSLGFCRNRLANIASGQIISFVDDDVILAPGWGKAIYEAFSIYKCDVVAGLLLPPRTYRRIIQQSLSRYVARGLTVYNTWFTCRSKTNILTPELIIIRPHKNNKLACSSGLWGANLSIRKSFYKEIIKQEVEKLGYVNSKPIGGDDTVLIINSFLANGKICLSLRAVEYHFTEAYKMRRDYIIKKYWHISSTYKDLLNARENMDRGESLSIFKEGINTIINEIMNDFSVKPFSLVDTLSLFLIILLRKFVKKFSNGQ